jgi:hypothetical protein
MEDGENRRRRSEGFAGKVGVAVGVERLSPELADEG